MDIKWLEDLIALARTGSLAAAARQRHVTQPAFGRRIRALEAWAGQALVDRQRKPVALTEAGHQLQRQAAEVLQGLLAARAQLQSLDRAEEGLRLATGRTLARTWVADWLLRMTAQAKPAWVQVKTGSLSETLIWLEAEQVDLVVAYYHPSMAQRPQGRSLLQKVLARDRLVPVIKRRLETRRGARPRHDQALPLLAYAPSLALAGLVQDHLERSATPVPVQRVLESDSADALLEYTIKGMGLCWLPWSLAAGPCRQGLLQVLWDRSMEIGFEVRLVRRRSRLAPIAEKIWQLTPPA